MTKPDTKTEQERVDLLTSLGLDPTAPALIADVSATTPAKVDEDAEARARRQATPASEVVFDKAMIAHLTLDKEGRSEAVDVLFKHFKSPHKDKERHGLLWRRATEFVTQVALERKTQGQAPADPVKARVKASKEQRDIAALLVSRGIRAEDLAALLAST